MADIEAIGSSQFGNFSNINTGKNYQRYGSNTSLMATPSASNAFVQDGTSPNGNPAWCLWASSSSGAQRQFTTSYPAAFAATGTTVFSVYVVGNSISNVDITIRDSSSKSAICAGTLSTTSGTFSVSTNASGGTKVFIDRIVSGNTTWNRISFAMTGYTGSFEAFFYLGNLGFNPDIPSGRYMMNFADWQVEYERDRVTSYSRTEDVAPTQNNPGARALVYTPDPKAVGESTFDAFRNSSAGRNLLANSGQSNLVSISADYNYAGNSVPGPFGANTGDVYTAKNSGNVNRYLLPYNNMSFAANGTGYTLSFYALVATNYLYVQFYNNAQQIVSDAYLDMAAMEVALEPTPARNATNGAKFKIEDAGSNWRRVSMTIKGVTDSAIRWAISPCDTTSSPAAAATAGTALMYLDAWQYENSETATAYDATGATAPNVSTPGAYARRMPTAFATGNSVVQAFQNVSVGSNLIPRSGDSSVLWIQRGSVYTVTDNVIDAPTGTMQGDAFRASTSGSAQRLVTLQHANLACDGTPYTLSVFVKSSHRYIYFAVDNTNRTPYTLPFEAYFDLQNLVAQPVNASRDAGFATTYQITDAGDGWRRISATFTANIPVGMCGYILPADTFNVASSTDTLNTVAMYLDGTQYERGSKLSPYGKTGTTVPSSAPGATGTLGPAPRMATGDVTFAAFRNTTSGRNTFANSGSPSLTASLNGNYTLAENSVDAPTGAGQGDVFRTGTNGTTTRYIFFGALTPIISTGAQQTFSYYIQTTDNRYFYFGVNNNGGATVYGEVYFDLVLNTANGSTPSRDAPYGTTYAVTDAGNGWRRISMTFTAPAGINLRFYLTPCNAIGSTVSSFNAGLVSFRGDGFQVENGSVATTYEKTGATAPISNDGASARVIGPPISANGVSTIATFTNQSITRNIFPNSGNASLYTLLTLYSSASFTIADNVIDAPTGAMQGDRFTTTSAGTFRRYANVNLTPATDGRRMNISFYVKTTRAFFYLGIDNSNATPVPSEACYNMSTFATTSFNTSRDASFGTTYSVVDAGDGWRRISTSFTPSVGLNLRLYLCPSDSAGSTNYNAQAGDVFYIDGMQVEYGSDPTAYQKTGATAPTVVPGAAGMLGPKEIIANSAITMGAFVNQTTTNNTFANSGEPSKWVNFRFGGVSMAEKVIDSPIGSMSGYGFSATAAGNAVRYVNMGTVTALTGTNAVQTHSWYVKSNTALFYFGVDNSGNTPVYAEAYFNLQTISVTSANATRDQSYSATYSITDAGNGWRRIVASFAIPTNVRYLIYTTPIISAASTQSSAAAGEVLFYADGFQIEPGTTATPYQRTGAVAPSTVPGATGQLGPLPLELTISQTVGPFTSNATALRLTVIEAIGETSIAKFVNVSDGYNIFPYSGSTAGNFILDDYVSNNVVPSPLGPLSGDPQISRGASDRSRGIYYRGEALTIDAEAWVFSFYAKTDQPYLTLNIRSSVQGEDRLVPIFDAQKGELYGWSFRSLHTTHEPVITIYPFDNGWYRYAVSFRNVTGTITPTLFAHSFSQNLNVNVPAGGTIMVTDGWQLERGRLPRAYQETTTPVPNQNVQGARAEIIYPTLLANAETNLDAFTSNAAAMYVNLARATQTFPGPFTQDAHIGYAPLSLSGTSTFGEFTMNAGKATSFYGRSAINVGRASTTREVFHPANLKVGDLIVLIAGSHSDGYDDIDLDADSDFKLQGMVRGPSHRQGYRQSLWMWTKEATAEDVMATVYYNLPSNYTDPVVWAQSYVFSNASRVEGFVSHVDAEDTYASASPQVASFNAGRTAVLVWQSSAVTNTGGSGFWEAATQSSSIGPGFTTVIEYASLKEANTLSKTRSWGAPTKAMAVGFSVVPGGSEGGVLIEAIGNSTIDAFRSIKDIMVVGETTFDNFVSVGRQIMAVEGDQTVAPFTSNSIGNVVVSANANTTATAFGTFTSRGFQTIAFYGNSRTSEFTSNATIRSMTSFAARSFVDEFTANAAANVFVGVSGTSIIDPFTSDRVMVYSNTAVTVGEYVSNAVARALVMANTANTAMGAFTSNSAAGPIVKATSNTILEAFIANSIYTEASAISMVGAFSANTVAQAIVSANTISSFDNFTQEAGNVIFIRDNVPMEEFTSNATGEVLILANAVTDLGEFTFTPRPGTRIRNIVSSRGAMRTSAVTQQVIMEFVEPTREATGESSFGEFGSEGSARVLTRSLEHGGVKFKGSFKGGLSNGSPNIRISGRKRI